MTEIVRLHAVPSHRVTDPEPLWREVLGQRLRELRRRRGETLTETAERAGISPQYLSEIERGLKDPSSEVLAAVAGALGATLVDLTSQVDRRPAQLVRRSAPRRRPARPSLLAA